MPKIIATKEDWIKLGYKLFSQTGFSGIVIEKMAKSLEVNKSSFYWHFKTKKLFIENLAEYWVNIETEQIIILTNGKKSTSEKLKSLVALTYKKTPYLDFIFYLKRYAQKEIKIQITIDDIDDKRISYVKELLIELGITEIKAEIKAKILYKHLIGYHEMIRYKKQSKNYLIEVMKELNEFIKY